MNMIRSNYQLRRLWNLHGLLAQPTVLLLVINCPQVFKRWGCAWSKESHGNTTRSVAIISSVSGPCASVNSRQLLIMHWTLLIPSMWELSASKLTVAWLHYYFESIFTSIRQFLVIGDSLLKSRGLITIYHQVSRTRRRGSGDTQERPMQKLPTKL